MSVNSVRSTLHLVAELGKGQLIDRILPMSTVASATDPGSGDAVHVLTFYSVNRFTILCRNGVRVSSNLVAAATLIGDATLGRK